MSPVPPPIVAMKSLFLKSIFYLLAVVRPITSFPQYIPLTDASTAVPTRHDYHHPLPSEMGKDTPDHGLSKGVITWIVLVPALFLGFILAMYFCVIKPRLKQTTRLSSPRVRRPNPPINLSAGRLRGSIDTLPEYIRNDSHRGATDDSVPNSPELVPTLTNESSSPTSDTGFSDPKSASLSPVPPAYFASN